MFSLSAVRHRSRDIRNFLLIILTPFLLWTSLCYATQSSSPVQVVISESMEPTFYRGDVLILSNRKPYVDVGDIPVCWFPGRTMPMVHRAVKVVNVTSNIHPQGGIRQNILTKGDNNVLTDETLYPSGQKFVHRDQIVGIVMGRIPYLGLLTILLNQYAWIKFALLGLATLGPFVL